MRKLREQTEAFRGNMLDRFPFTIASAACHTLLPLTTGA